MYANPGHLTIVPVVLGSTIKEMCKDQKVETKFPLFIDMISYLENLKQSKDKLLGLIRDKQNC
jgi:hypothetical protein